MPRKYRRWSRAEYDQLEQLVNEDRRYSEIAEIMGREPMSIQGAVQRLGMSRKERMSLRARKDWKEIDQKLVECIELRLMTVPQACRHINSIGHSVGLSMLYKRAHTLPPSVQRMARENAVRRMTSVCRRIHLGMAARRRAAS